VYFTVNVYGHHTPKISKKMSQKYSEKKSSAVNKNEAPYMKDLPKTRCNENINSPARHDGL
jgi:hypothetical protein